MGANAEAWRPTTREEQAIIGDVLWREHGGGRDRERYLEARRRMQERERVPWFPLGTFPLVSRGMADG